MTHEDVRQAIGRRLRESRIVLRRTQEDVGSEMTRSRQAVSAWERGEALPTLQEFVELVELYGVSSDQILFGVSNVAVQCEATIKRASAHQDFAESGYTD